MIFEEVQFYYMVNQTSALKQQFDNNLKNLAYLSLLLQALILLKKTFVFLGNLFLYFHVKHPFY